MAKDLEQSAVKGRLLTFINYLNISVLSFERSCGMPNATIQNMRVSIAPDKLEAIANAYPQLNIEWLMVGRGEMLNAQKTDEEVFLSGMASNKEHSATLPLVPIDAVAGYNGWDEAGVTLADCPQYSVPDFIAVKAEFLIRVSGSSMYPKYSSGDILACRKIQEIRFIQWGKIYVIDSSQGMMVKRLFEIDDDKDNVLCKSDNPNYPPFVLPKDDIRSLSIVVGAIRLE